ncbi:hypothetical protein IFM89_030019 [Coptis chinensis]|uniref:RRM domain-containing protein n=1 Tax=Coptis chinensis TaxID=261450 RepID=A0A835IR16_9MAGN|nr:hypothetical protein IFM89_030019 [Coptis chinensis]
MIGSFKGIDSSTGSERKDRQSRDRQLIKWTGSSLIGKKDGQFKWIGSSGITTSKLMGVIEVHLPIFIALNANRKSLNLPSHSAINLFVNVNLRRQRPILLVARGEVHFRLKTFSRNKTVPWQRGLLEDSLIVTGYSGNRNVWRRLYVSNLHSGVTYEDIKELFSLIGELKRYNFHSDRNGRSSGSAKVIFTRRVDALAAMK